MRSMHIIGSRGLGGAESFFMRLVLGLQQAGEDVISVNRSGSRIGTELNGRVTQMRALMLKSAQGFMIQTAHTALANGRAKLEQRLARWLLMAHDRLTSNAVPLTHEFLAVMLGVRRAGVTVAIHSFEQRGFVTTRRGQLTVVNRGGIEQVAGSFYGTPEAELKRLFDSGARA